MFSIIFLIYGTWLFIYGAFALIYGCVYIPNFKKMGWLIWFLIIIPPLKCDPIYRGKTLVGHTIFSMLYITIGGALIYFNL